MATTQPSLADRLRASLHRMTVHTADGDYTVDPAMDPLGYKRLLGQSYDARTQADRDAAAAANPNPVAPGRNYGLEQTVRAQTDAAMGPAGWNRQWAEFLEAPRVLGDNLGTVIRADASGMGIPTSTEVLRRQASDPSSVAIAARNAGMNRALSDRSNMVALQQRAMSQPMPLDQDAFESQLYAARGRPGTDVAKPAPPKVTRTPSLVAPPPIPTTFQSTGPMPPRAPSPLTGDESEALDWLRSRARL